MSTSMELHHQLDEYVAALFWPLPWEKQVAANRTWYYSTSCNTSMLIVPT
jgi:hypothetical protein